MNSIADIRARGLREIVADIDRDDDREPILRRELLDQPSHLSVTDDREFHLFKRRRVRVA